MHSFKSILLAAMTLSTVSYANNTPRTQSSTGKALVYGICAGIIASGIAKGGAAVISKITGITAQSTIATAASKTAQWCTAAFLSFLAGAASWRVIDTASSGELMKNIDIATFGGLVANTALSFC